MIVFDKILNNFVIFLLYVQPSLHKIYLKKVMILVIEATLVHTIKFCYLIVYLLYLKLEN